MFYTTLGALLLVALGSTLLASTLGEHILAFLAWWGACAWLLLATVLLALFDLLSIRTAARRARRELAREILARENENPR